MTITNLVWLRQDLRLADNPALAAGQAGSARIVACYLVTPGQWRAHHMAPIQADLIYRRLQFLARSFDALGIPLVVRRVDDFSGVADEITGLCRQWSIASVYCQAQYELNETRRDQAVARQLALAGVGFKQLAGDCLIAPGSLKTCLGGDYRVFTPFKRAWLAALANCGWQSSPGLAPQPRFDPAPPESALNQLFDYPRRDSRAWPVEDRDIDSGLATFCQQGAADYHRQRDFPAVNGTSGLSPYLATGMLSVRQCLQALVRVHGLPQDSEGGAATWLSEMIWREFYRHVLAANPALCRHQAFQAWTARIPWQRDEAALEAWQRGRTGFPIVDAAMRQLQATGWMHNRLRMIVASFLTKDLLIDWRLGERWFMSQLIDGDFASNNGGWQWAASTGTDAQPYFRIFNPTTQGERFDPAGDFVRSWIPELARVPGRAIHQPHKWASANNRSLDYPAPVVDHAVARKRAIELFAAVRDASTTAG